MTTETAMIYFDDLDAMGVVRNGRYVILFERALGAYWTRAGWPYDPGQPRFAEVLMPHVEDPGWRARAVLPLQAAGSGSSLVDLGDSVAAGSFRC